jgi:hypothetical protein
MLYSTNQFTNVEEAVKQLENSQEAITLENISNWLNENERGNISYERIDAILISLGYC